MVQIYCIKWGSLLLLFYIELLHNTSSRSVFIHSNCSNSHQIPEEIITDKTIHSASLFDVSVPACHVKSLTGTKYKQQSLLVGFSPGQAGGSELALRFLHQWDFPYCPFSPLIHIFISCIQHFFLLMHGSYSSRREVKRKQKNRRVKNIVLRSPFSRLGSTRKIHRK